MAEIVNLRMARKRADRRHAEQRASMARAVHGVPKVDRKRAQEDRSKLRRELDKHRIETGETDEIAGH